MENQTIMEFKLFQGDAVNQQVEWLENQLGLSNERIAPNESFQPFVFLLLEKGENIGGIVAYKSWDWLVIDSLVILEPYQNLGFGKRLVEKAEVFGKSIGCKRAKLETFQAEKFYKKLGYVTKMFLEDYPPGFHFSTMVKQF